MNVDFSRLKRPEQPMPGFVEQGLNERGLMGAFRSPTYQQNDYLGWINRAKRQETKQKRLSRRLDELEAGGVYMGAPRKTPPDPAPVKSASPHS